MHTIAAQLLGSGAAINDTMSDGQTLLHMAIKRQDSKSALFLLEHQADINVRYTARMLLVWIKKKSGIFSDLRFELSMFLCMSIKAYI